MKEYNVIMAEEKENGIKWWLRYVVVPLIGSGGIVAIIVALIVKPPTPSLTPTNSPTIITTEAFTFEPTVTVFTTPTSTSTLTPSTTYMPSPTLTPIPSPFFYDTFYSNQHGWALDLTADSGIVERYIRGGKFVHSLDCSHETTICREFIAVPEIVVSDFSFSFESRLVRASESALIGIIFRKKDNENYYYAYFQNDGEFIVAMRYNGEFYILQDWDRSDYINTGIGGLNTLGISAFGPKFILSANGYDVAVIEDGNIKSGGLEVGVMVPAGQSAQVEFDNMQVVLP